MHITIQKERSVATSVSLQLLLYLPCSDRCCEAVNLLQTALSSLSDSNSFPSLPQESGAAGLSEGRTSQKSGSTALVRPGASVDAPSDGQQDSVPTALTSTLQHMVGQLDVLTQVTDSHQTLCLHAPMSSVYNRIDASFGLKRLHEKTSTDPNLSLILMKFRLD